MPAVASLDELKSVQHQLEEFAREFPAAEKKIIEILKANRKIGYKNICKMLMREATPEQLKSGNQD